MGADLGEKGQPYASLVGTLLRDEDPTVVAAACEALPRMGPDGAAFEEDIQPLANHPCSIISEAAHASLATLARFSGRHVAPIRRLDLLSRPILSLDRKARESYGLVSASADSH